MKNKIKKQIILCSAILLGISCADLGEVNINPDGITTATSQMLATKMILNIVRDDVERTKGFMGNFMRDKYILWSEFPQGQQYNDLGRSSFGRMTRLIDVEKMIALTEDLDEGEKNSYTGLGHFMRAYMFFGRTMQVGDIPYSEALKAESEGNIKPKYDTQKEVFLGILNELDQADQLFANGSTFDGDIIYGGDPLKWRKMVNSFALHVLINLYKKTGDSDLQVVQRFNAIVNNRPIFESNADNFSLVYSNKDGQMYPFYKQGNQFIIYPMVSDILINTLKDLNDYRLFYYAAPSSVKLDNGLSASDFDAYVGVDPAIEYSDLSAIASSADYSDVNNRYKEIPEGEPVYLLSYAQVQFILSEASVRGWISGNAETYYTNGIKAAMNFVADNTPDDADFHHNRILDETFIQNYPETPQVKFTASFDAQLEQIITQKYLSTYLQSPLSSFFENRRTGYPEFPINPETNENVPSNILPVRWMYPSDEVDYNKENLDEAVNRQYGGN
ncbi:MAG TPA: SusD/RagB family nutrient-binding outer membrane lipoprotein, partial [Arenibacter sp.]|nr:SusD/RagB family nutrient-binding outer membrane lipoprotein [Arenibacter sp.]